MHILYILLSMLAWGFIHSLLATLSFKERMQQTFGPGIMRFYRLAYNLFSALSFLPILWLVAVLPDRPLYRIPAPWLYLSLGGQLLAAVLLVIGVLQTDTLSFIGLRQLLEGREKPGPLIVRGLYRWVRHPLYTAGLLFIWPTSIMTVNTLTLYAAATIYILIGAYFEERKLRREYGADYAEYQASTPMLIPGLRFQRRNK
ncbi:MAG: isoprenylcysteine carboxylmethyltransferase family protein [Anaerolineales bacterium]